MSDDKEIVKACKFDVEKTIITLHKLMRQIHYATGAIAPIQAALNHLVEVNIHLEEVEKQFDGGD